MKLWLRLLPVLAVIACDPGWEYHAVAPLPSADSIAIRLQVHRVRLFAGDITAELTIDNTSGTAATVDTSWFTLRDARGIPLPRIGLIVCDSSRVASIAAGKHCDVLASWGADPFGKFFRRNSQLRTLSLIVARRSGNVMAIDSIPLSWGS